MFDDTEVNYEENIVEKEKEEILEQIKLNNVEVPIKKKRKEKISSQDIQDMSDKEILDISNDEIKELYLEFSSFVETKTDIKRSEDKGFFPTPIKLLNAILGGGFLLKSFNTIVGNPGCGKSMLMMQSLGNAQIFFKKKCVVSVLDSENATTTERLANLGVRYPRIRPFSEDLTVERFFQFLETTCLYKEEKGIIEMPSLIGWDSIANTMTIKELEASDPKEVVGYRARVYSLLMPKYVAKCAKYNISILSVNQLRDSVQMGNFPKPKDLKFMSQDYDVPGGKALKYNASQFVEMRQYNMSKGEIDKYGFEGLVVELMCVKNRLFRPKMPIRIIGDFTTGFSDFWTNYVFLVDNKQISTGAWNYLVNFSDKKFRTKDAEQLYNNDKDFKIAYDEAVENIIYREIIESNIVGEFDDEF